MITTYNISVKLKVADSLNVESISIGDTLGSIINKIIDETERYRQLEVEVKAKTVENNDNDLILITGSASENANYSDITVRSLRKLMIDSLTELCTQYLDSIVYEITDLNVIKS